MITGALRAGAFACVSAACALAQTSVHGSVAGTVLDSHGRAIAEARVQLSNSETARVSLASTDSTGAFYFPRVLPGAYELVVEKTGFQRSRREAVRVSVNEVVDADFQLQPGEVVTTVDVIAETPAIQTQTTNVSLLLDESNIRELPLNGKDFQKLMFLAPGMANFRANNPNSNASSSGTRESSNNYAVDGITANDERETAGLALGAPFRQQPNVISTEALREYRIITSNADATFGRGSGAQVNVVTKSGSNEVHGSAYEYLRNSAFDARDFFNHGPFYGDDGRAKTPPFRQNLFGATVGGPIQRNRHFFFGSYEGFRQRLQQTSSPVLPSGDLVRLFPGDLGRLANAFYFDQDIVPRTGFDRGSVLPFPASERTAAIAAGFPGFLFDADLSNGEAATVQVSRSSTRDFKQNSFLIRTDHTLSDSISAFARYAQADNTYDTNSSGLPGTGVRSPGKFRSAALETVWTPSATQIIELRAGFLRRDAKPDVLGGLAPSLVTAGVDPVHGLALTATGTASFTLPAISPFLINDSQTVPHISGQHTWSRRALTVRAGFDVRRIAVNFLNRSFARPTYTFTGLTGANGLLGSSPGAAQAVAANASNTVFGANGGPTTPQRGWRSSQQEYFVQTDWRMSRDVTVNAGLRYSYFGVYGEANDAIGNLYALDPSGAIAADATVFAFGRLRNEMAPIESDRPLYQPDRNNFQPRAGVAWNIGGGNHTVVRAAFGLYYDRLYQLVISEAARNVPFAITGNAANVPFVAGQPVPINPRIPVTFTIDPKLKNPQVRRWNLSLEQRLDSSTTVTAAYVSTQGRDLFMTEDPNFTGAFPQNSRPDPRFSDQRILRNLAWSDYHALQVHATRRYSRGLTFTAAYTLSEYKDVTSTDTIFSVVPTLINTGASPASGFQIGEFRARPIDSEYGFSENDARHALAIGYRWELPTLARGSLLQRFTSGWSFSGLLNARSGNTFDVTLGQDVNDDGAFNDRPAVISGSIESLRNRASAEKTQWLIPQSAARSFLVVAADVTDPYAPIARNSFRGPAFVSMDVSFARRFRVTERVALNFDANAFNVLNRANFRPPQSNLSSAFFGQVQASAVMATPRQLQFGIKLVF